jgi:hypothetical protein
MLVTVTRLKKSELIARLEPLTLPAALVAFLLGALPYLAEGIATAVAATPASEASQCIEVLLESAVVPPERAWRATPAIFFSAHIIRRRCLAASLIVLV